MTITAVLEEAMRLYTQFFWRFVGTAAVVFVILDLASAFADRAAHGSGGWNLGWDLFWTSIALMLSFVGSFWMQGALVEAVSDVRDGRIDTTIGELYTRTRPRLAALIVAGILAGVGIVLGLLLLIVPGLFLLTRWALIPAVIVIEKRRAGDAFDRSWELTRGYGWTVFGSLVLAFLAYIVVQGVLRAVFLPLPRFANIWIGGLVAHSVATPLIALTGAVLYFRLARISVGVAPESKPAGG
jgi:hypothetical protein